MLGYLSLDIICSEKRTLFLELPSRKTVSFEEQIMSKDKYSSIFSRQMNAIVYLVFTKSVDSNFRAFWLALVARNILGYSLSCERREKWHVVSRKFQKKILKKRYFYPSDLVNTKTTIPLRVGEERWIYTSTVRVSVYIHHYPPPLREIVVYYSTRACWIWNDMLRWFHIQQALVE